MGDIVNLPQQLLRNERVKRMQKRFELRTNKLAINGCIIIECPLKWESLTETDNLKRRHCNVCTETVYLVESDKEAQQHAEDKHCIAIQKQRRRKLMGYVIPTSRLEDFLSGDDVTDNDEGDE